MLLFFSRVSLEALTLLLWEIMIQQMLIIQIRAWQMFPLKGEYRSTKAATNIEGVPVF